MLVDEAEARLEDLLRAGGVDLAAPDPRATWEVFKRFAAISAEDTDSDGLLFEFGTYEWINGRVVQEARIEQDWV